MADADNKMRRRGAVKLGDLIGKVLDPVTARRGFATADLIASWAEIAGQRYADCSRPEKIFWPRGEAREGEPATLVLRVEGPRAVLLQHEAGQIVERINAFLGYGAIGQIRIVQGPVGEEARRTVPEAPVLAPEAEARLSETIAAVADTRLKEALDRLGRGVLGRTKG